ncbi:type II toxin-antitoxin system Phd/YefM family antitoxin [Sulfurimonas sp. NWX79]|uniref:type II toxin-antitoxin system Phd/YefM family antitoxin n=1 Tax=Sulfurimonas sp. NWX79 TaxID=2925412 RepID=UPI00320479EA
MTNIMSASQARADIYNLIDKTAQTHEPIIITGKRNNVVMISQEDWEAIEETLYLNSIPNLSKSIQDAMKADDSEFSENIEW